MARKSKYKSLVGEDDRYDLTSMIDVVFLLLIYFMTLPIQQESDLNLQLPVEAPPPTENTPLPNELQVHIFPDGSVFFNQAPIDVETQASGKFKFKELEDRLKILKASDDASGTLTVVTIVPDQDSPHQSLISVLNACKEAKIKAVSLAATK